MFLIGCQHNPESCVWVFCSIDQTSYVTSSKPEKWRSEEGKTGTVSALMKWPSLSQDEERNQRPTVNLLHLASPGPHVPVSRRPLRPRQGQVLHTPRSSAASVLCSGYPSTLPGMTPLETRCGPGLLFNWNTLHETGAQLPPLLPKVSPVQRHRLSGIPQGSACLSEPCIVFHSLVPFFPTDILHALFTSPLAWCLPATGSCGSVCVWWSPEHRTVSGREGERRRETET